MMMIMGKIWIGGRGGRGGEGGRRGKEGERKGKSVVIIW